MRLVMPLVLGNSMLTTWCTSEQFVISFSSGSDIRPLLLQWTPIASTKETYGQWGYHTEQ